MRDSGYIDPDPVTATSNRGARTEERDVSNEFRKLILAVTTLVFLASCGGSDGNGGNQNPIIVSGDLVDLSSDNAMTVAGVVAEEVVEDNFLKSLTDTGLPVVASGNGAAVALSNLAAQQLPPGVLGASIPQDCAVEGSVDVTVEVSNPLTITRGDRFTFLFAACNDGAGAIIDGDFIMTVTDFEGDPTGNAFYLAVNLELAAFSIAEGGDVTSATGTVSIEIDSRTPMVTTINVSTGALVVTQNGVVETLQNVSITVSEDDSVFPTAVTVQQSFRISSPRLGGDVIVSTTISLQSSGEEFPFTGELEIQAAGNSAIVLIVLDSNMVRLEIDLDGDNAADEVVDTTWAELIAAAEAA